MTEVMTDSQVSDIDLKKAENEKMIADWGRDQVVGLITSLQLSLQEEKVVVREERRRRVELMDTIEEFLKDKVSANHVDVSDLKELAEELDITLTKKVSVEFTVKYSGAFEVPLDKDIDSLFDDGDFDVSIEYSGSADGVELDCEDVEIDSMLVDDLD